MNDKWSQLRFLISKFKQKLIHMRQSCKKKTFGKLYIKHQRSYSEVYSDKEIKSENKNVTDSNAGLLEIVQHSTCPIQIDQTVRHFHVVQTLSAVLFQLQLNQPSSPENKLPAVFAERQVFHVTTRRQRTTLLGYLVTSLKISKSSVMQRRIYEAHPE